MDWQKSAEAIVPQKWEGLNNRGSGNLKETPEKPRKQNTACGHAGFLREVGVEPRGNVEALSKSATSERRKNGIQREQEDLLERILSKDNLNLAYGKVKANKGSHGVDGMTVDELLLHLKRHGEELRQSILKGVYEPQPVRRLEIPKPDGGVRLLGIPTVVDRMIQQAIAQELTKIFDPDFSENSYGFRPGKSAHQAVIAARGHIERGYVWTVDIDLEKFFDKVNHKKLMNQVARKVTDKRVLKLISRYLESGIMMNGVKVKSEEGTPQGGPLSPLLANIMLDDLDKELEKRGHKACRYADDCNIYVKSQRAGERVMEGVSRFIETVLKLKINRNKSAVDRPSKRKFLGFSFYKRDGKIRNYIPPKPIQRFKTKVREATGRSNGRSMEDRQKRLNWLITGWVNYFRIADMKSLAMELDMWIRRRIRMCYWKQWKKVGARHDNLVKLGIPNGKAWEYANTRKGCWRIAGSYILDKSLTNKYLEDEGFLSLTIVLSEG
jgi:group II intron reverse transcriptase/maturase